jgi:hypothetical protein
LMEQRFSKAEFTISNRSTGLTEELPPPISGRKSAL